MRARDLGWRAYRRLCRSRRGPRSDPKSAFGGEMELSIHSITFDGRIYISNRLMSVIEVIVLQKPKVALVRIIGGTLERAAIDDSYKLSRATEVAYEFSVRR